MAHSSALRSLFLCLLFDYGCEYITFHRPLALGKHITYQPTHPVAAVLLSVSTSRLSYHVSISLPARCLCSGPSVWTIVLLSLILADGFSLISAWGMTLAARPLSLPLQQYAFNLTHGMVGAALLHR